MKPFKILFFLLFICQYSFSQMQNFNYNSPEFTNLIKGTLYIIPTGNQVYDDSLAIAVKKYWTITPSKVVSGEELDTYLGDEKNYFIGVATYSDGPRSSFCLIKDPVGKGFYNLNIFHGGKHNLKRREVADQTLMGCGEFLFFDHKYDVNCLGFTIKKLNNDANQIILKKDAPMGKRWDGKQEVVRDNKDLKNLKTKTLLVNSIFLKYRLTEDVLGLYKYKYQVATSDEIMALMQSDPGKYCILSDSGVIQRGALSIFDAQSESRIYYNVGKTAAKIIDKLILELNEDIDKN